MSKIVIVWAVAVIFMVMATAVASAADVKLGADAGKGKPDEVKSFSRTNIPSANEAVVKPVSIGWGRYGPITSYNISAPSSLYFRIYYGGTFSQSPAIGDTLDVQYPADQYTVYSLGADSGYTTTTYFDARLRTYSGILHYPTYIDWQAIGY